MLSLARTQPQGSSQPAQGALSHRVCASSSGDRSQVQESQPEPKTSSPTEEGLAHKLVVFKGCCVCLSGATCPPRAWRRRHCQVSVVSDNGRDMQEAGVPLPHFSTLSAAAFRRLSA